MDGVHNFWPLGEELRGLPKVSEDHDWSMAASKLAEYTRSKADRRINIDVSKGLADTRTRASFGYQEDNKYAYGYQEDNKYAYGYQDDSKYAYGHPEDNKFENFNFNMLNLDTKFNERPVKASQANGVYGMNIFQNPTPNLSRAISGSKYNSVNLYKDPNNGNNMYNAKDDDTNANNTVDKKFKTLPAAEILPRNEVFGGYIFVCNNDTMQEDLKRQLFGLPPRYRDSVRAITPGLPLFLYNYTTHQLHGIFEATTFGGSNIDPTAWEDKKCKGESRFPAQVRIRIRKHCKPLEEDAFRPVLHHYDGPKFRLELSVPETLELLDLCEQAGIQNTVAS